MTQRPDSVTVISILCILFGALSFVVALLILAGTGNLPVWVNPQRAEAFNILQFITFVDSAILVVCGINFMKGANWARWVFLFDAVISTALWVALFSDKVEAGVTTFGFRVICILILFLPAANRYFNDPFNR